MCPGQNCININLGEGLFTFSGAGAGAGFLTGGTTFLGITSGTGVGTGALGFGCTLGPSGTPAGALGCISTLVTFLVGILSTWSNLALASSIVRDSSGLSSIGISLALGFSSLKFVNPDFQYNDLFLKIFNIYPIYPITHFYSDIIN